MGVPKFFRYTSERYPSLNELVKQFQIPEFDNMYLDMNGIIHNCSHPDDSNPHFRITEQKIFEDIFHYISILFRIIKPKKLFFMAIDGVAPRAKMNQQRGRRFRSAREAEVLEERAKAKGETLPSEKRFDSNCITPGTVFMARLHEQLKYFVKKKISTDPLWSKCRVVLSGHETPGEGEHKIMDYIRWARSQPDYDPDTRHCLYGLDADLIMLGMCTHEPHFALLREEVKFGKSTQRATSPEETNFYLLHLSLMRDYLEQEFLAVKDKLPFEWDLEKIVDDWVLMGFLVGNDFIPNLPNMHISNDALPLLYKTYMKILPMLDGYINEMGNLNLRRFETFMQELAKIDKEAFQETYADLRFFQEKTGRRPNANERKVYKPNDDDTFNVNVEDIKSGHNDDLQALISATDMLLNDLDDEDDEDCEDMSDEEANFHNEFVLHKKDYYMNKLDYAKVTPQVLASQAECYVRAIQWNLHYYYHGCASWCWYYPHHYAPYISDIRGFHNLKIEFELGEPFRPFEQLLAVLPSASKALLPDPFHALMTEDVSPIVEYYPINFETDLNGKKNDWEAVVLIPFIDEKRLLSAMSPLYEELTPEETKRNTHGPMLVYNYTQHSLGRVPAPEYFAEIAQCHCSETLVWRSELDMPLERLRRGVLPGAHIKLYYPGFPTMKHLQYTTVLKKNKCRVFDQPSRNDNMIVMLTRREDDPLLEAAARELLGRTVWVGWPHLTQAKVISVSNEKQRLHLVKNKRGAVNGDAHAVSFTQELNVGNLHKQWIMERSTIVEHNLGRMGIDLGDINVIVHAVNLKGHKYVVQSNTSLAVENVWCEVPCGYAYQAVLKEVEHKSSAVRRNAAPQEVFPPGAGVFLMTGPYYGCLAQVVSAEDVGRSGRVKVQVSASEEPHTNSASAAHGSQYKLAHHVAATTGITTQLLSRLTGCILVLPGERNNLPTEQQNKFNIGLNLKFNKKNQEVCGYTRRCPTTNQWLYSTLCVELVAKYVETYPDVIQALSYSSGNDIFYEGELWPGRVGEGKPQEIVDWLKQQPHSSAGRRDCGAEALEPEEMLRLAESIDNQLAAVTQQEKRVTLQIKLGLLYMPNLNEGNISPDPQADFQLYDRVVCAARNLTVPIGAKGTITAIYRTGPANTVRLSDKLNIEPTYQIMFDQAFPGGMTEELFTQYRFYRLSGCHLLNISFGRSLRDRNDHVAQDNFQPQLLTNTNTNTKNKPNQLRTNDGHHSAFASYSSPTKERQTPADNYQQPSPTVPTFDSQEKSTELLKSLLKISETYTAPVRPKTSQENWRARNDVEPMPKQQQQQQQQHNARPQRQIRTQQQENWRNDNASSIPVATIGQRVQPVWNPSLLQSNVPQSNKPNDPTHGGAVPPLPFPNFSQLPPPPAGFPYQLPPPRPPPFAHAHGTNKPAFPTHLPNVTAQNFAFGQQSEPPAGTASAPDTAAPSGVPEPTTPTAHNPFVPLQVVAKQRRNQNASAATNKNNVDTASAAIAAPNDQPYAVPLPQNNQITNHGADSSKPRRKRKSRIAANLPIE